MLGSVHTTMAKFENADLFIGLDLASTIIRRESKAGQRVTEGFETGLCVTLSYLTCSLCYAVSLGAEKF